MQARKKTPGKAHNIFVFPLWRTPKNGVPPKKGSKTQKSVGKVGTGYGILFSQLSSRCEKQTDRTRKKEDATCLPKRKKRLSPRKLQRAAKYLEPRKLKRIAVIAVGGSAALSLLGSIGHDRIYRAAVAREMKKQLEPIRKQLDELTVQNENLIRQNELLREQLEKA